jgi:hypothetical protein
MNTINKPRFLVLEMCEVNFKDDPDAVLGYGNTREEALQDAFGKNWKIRARRFIIREIADA